MAHDHVGSMRNLGRGWYILALGEPIRTDIRPRFDECLTRLGVGQNLRLLDRACETATRSDSVQEDTSVTTSSSDRTGKNTRGGSSRQTTRNNNGNHTEGSSNTSARGGSSRQTRQNTDPDHPTGSSNASARGGSSRQTRQNTDPDHPEGSSNASARKGSSRQTRPKTDRDHTEGFSNTSARGGTSRQTRQNTDQNHPEGSSNNSAKKSAAVPAKAVRNESVLSKPVVPVLREMKARTTGRKRSASELVDAAAVPFISSSQENKNIRRYQVGDTK